MRRGEYQGLDLTPWRFPLSHRNRGGAPGQPIMQGHCPDLKTTAAATIAIFGIGPRTPDALGGMDHHSATVPADIYSKCCANLTVCTNYK